MSTATPMNALLTSFMKFDGTNWFKYKHSVKMLLLRERSWDPVAVADGTSSVLPPAAADAKAHAEWVSKDELAYSTLFFTIDSSIHYLIQDVQTGSAAWTLLKKEYESNIRSRRYDIRQRFNKPSHDPSKSIEVYIQGILQARSELKAIGIDVSDQEASDMIVMHLHSSYDTVRTTLIARQTEPSLSELQSILKEADRDMRKDMTTSDAETALAARRFGGPKKKFHETKAAHSSGSIEDEKGHRWCDPTNENHCHRCGRTGHIAARCIADMPPEIKTWVLSRPGRERNEISMYVGRVSFTNHRPLSRSPRPASPRSTPPRSPSPASSDPDVIYDST